MHVYTFTYLQICTHHRDVAYRLCSTERYVFCAPCIGEQPAGVALGVRSIWPGNATDCPANTALVE